MVRRVLKATVYFLFTLDMHCQVTLGFVHIFSLSEGFIHILRRFCTNFKMRRNYTYSKKVLYIFSINAKDLRRCEGFAKEIYTPYISTIEMREL